MKTLLALIFIVSCGGPSKMQFSVKDTTFGVSDALKQSVSYNEVVSKVFANSCLSCHDSGSKIPLNTYESAVAHLKDIKKTVLLKQSMPRAPVSVLTKNQLQLVAAWIEAGAPREPLNGDHVEPEPELRPDYESIKARIIDRKCLTCHSSGGNASQIPLVTKDDLLSSNLDIVVPGNPDDSGFMIVLEEGARKFMPPKKSGFTSVSEAEKAIIRLWIAQGAP